METLHPLLHLLPLLSSGEPRPLFLYCQRSTDHKVSSRRLCAREHFPKTLRCSCDKGYTICRILNLFGYIGIMAVWGLRTYAVCQRSKYILVLLGLPGAAVILLLLIQAPTSSCTGPPRFPGLRSATTGLLLFFEINAFLFATLRVWKTMRGRKYATLSTIVFSQGLTYMIPTFVLSVMSLSLNWIKFSPEFVRLTNAFKLPLAGLLTARFILKLRKWEANKGHLDSRPPVSVLRFAQDPPTLGNAAFARLSSYKAQASTRSMFDELGEDLDPR
ncbi:hypothetical protein BKA70DRAFT_728548 [Coprinopsis sp. MPI-PUGE-AT-0042]|nr:hypothetical protein BKA70DRAFT_728548 [Coprinopsis sp. MPI-PUGE-AT-0042]